MWSVDPETGKSLPGPYTDCPEIGYNLIHNFIFFLLALSTMRMKYLWTPHAAIMCTLVGLPGVWKKMGWKDGRFFLSLLLMASCLYHNKNDYESRTTKELEFHDPDTVELMEWAATVPKDSVFRYFTIFKISVSNYKF